MDFILTSGPSWAVGMWANGLQAVGLDLLVHPQVWVAEMFSGLWKRHWKRNGKGVEKRNGMESPFRRKKIELCVKSLCQRLPGSSQCYHSPAALGQEADNPPREFRGGNTSAGLGGGTGSSTREFVPSVTLHLQRHPWRSWGLPRLKNLGELGEKWVERGVLAVNAQKKKKNQCAPASWALICSCVSLPRPCSSWRCLFGFQRNGRELPQGLCRIEICCSTGRLMNETCTEKLRWSCIIPTIPLSDCSVCF